MPLDPTANSYIDENLTQIWQEMYRLRSWPGDLKNRPKVPHLDGAMTRVGYQPLTDVGYFRMWLMGYLLDKTEGEISRLQQIATTGP